MFKALSIALVERVVFRMPWGAYCEMVYPHGEECTRILGRAAARIYLCGFVDAEVYTLEVGPVGFSLHLGDEPVGITGFFKAR